MARGNSESTLRPWWFCFLMAGIAELGISLVFLSIFLLWPENGGRSAIAYDPHRNCLYAGSVYPAGAKIRGPDHLPLVCKKSQRIDQQDGMLTWEE